MGGSASRSKGSAWEREVAHLLQPVFPAARRGLGQARGGAEVPDVERTPYWVECKSRKRCNIQAALEQAERARALARDERVPLAACKDTGKRPIAAMYLDDLLALLALAHGVQDSPRESPQDAPAAPLSAEGVPPGVLSAIDLCGRLGALLRGLAGPGGECVPRWYPSPRGSNGGR